jgi:hypothetical protein
MAISLLGPLNKVINDTTTQIVDKKIMGKASEVVSSVVSIGFDAVDGLLKQVQDLTKDEPAPPPPSPPAP